MFGPCRLPCEIPTAAPPSPVVRSRWVLPISILGSSLGFIDGSVVNVALPAIQHSFGVSLATIQWVVNGYLVTSAGLILFGGSAADRLGLRRTFQVGLIGFGAASAACGLAPTVGWLIAARLVQGVAAALLVPTSLAMLGSGYSGQERERAIGTWAGAAALTTVLGPPFGGWLIDTLGWRAIFFVNPPIAAVGVLAALRIPADQPATRRAPLDLGGALWALLALGLISFGLITFGQNRPAVGALALAGAAPAAWLLIRTEIRAPAPMMPVRLFASRPFSGASVLTALLYAALSAALFLLPFLLINAYGYSAGKAGAALLPFAVLMGFGARPAGSLANRFGAKPSLVLGPSIAGAGYIVLGLSAGLQGYWNAVLPGLVLVGIGMTVAVPPLTSTVFESAPAEQSGTASGINNAAARIGGLVAVAALGLAFAGFGASTRPITLIAAYRLVMWASAALALLSALTAAKTMRGKEF